MTREMESHLLGDYIGSRRSAGGQPDISYAVKYMDNMKPVFSKGPEIYKVFLRILKDVENGAF